MNEPDLPAVDALINAHPGSCKQDVIIVLDDSSSITNRERGGRLRSFMQSKNFAVAIVRELKEELRTG